MPSDLSSPLAQPFEMEAGEDALLLLHGFTGTPAHVRYIAEQVHAAGFSARGILLPGHGTSLADMEQSTGAQWLDAARAAYDEMRAKYRTVSVAGLSLGGVLALLLAEAEQPACVITFAAAIRYKRAVNHLSPLAKHVLRELPWGGRSEDPAAFLYDYDIGYTATPVAKVEDMTLLQRRAREGLAQVTCPVLAFQSHRDQSVHRSGPQLIMDGAASRVKEVCWVDQSPHVLTLGADRAYVAERVIDFLRRYGV